MTQKHILTLGNPVYDYISTPYLRPDGRVLSGCSTNASLAVSKLGEKTTLVGTVGPDFHDQLASDLAHYRINARLFPASQTGGFGLVYDERGNRELTVLGIASELPSQIEVCDPPDFILVGPILGEVLPELVESLHAAYPATPVLFDPQGALRRIEGSAVIHRLSEQFTRIARISTIVKANELEARIVTGIDPRLDPEGAVRALHAFGCPIAVVTLAEAGSVIFDGTQLYFIPPYEVNAIDPTGAGDTYAAGFMVSFLEEPGNLNRVGCFASSVASVMVENSGPGFPLTRTEADRRSALLLAGRLAVRL